MAKTLSHKAVEVNVAQVVHHGEQMVLPEKMSLDGAIELLQRRKTYLEEEVVLHQSYAALPLDGANALFEVLTRRFGWATQEAIKTMFGEQPPHMVIVETGVNTTKQVPWGRLSMPGITGHLETGVEQKNGIYWFRLSAVIKRANEAQVKQLFEEVAQEVKDRSLYRGKAFRLRFRDDNGKATALLQPVFIDTADATPDGLVFSDKLKASIETNLFTPITRFADLKANGIPVKRGVLLGGTYGCGKTLAAKVAARLAEDAGITYCYVPRAEELSDAVEFAKLYQSPACVVFCEDIDRVMNGERSVKMDDILNIIDGIDTKSANIVVVLTTNNLTGINEAMLRPGRLDAVIEVTPPDAKAAESLLRLYGGGAIPETEDLTEVGKRLAGSIPAVIAEVVKRSKLAQLRLQQPGEPLDRITSVALAEAAETMRTQLTLLNRERPVVTPDVETAFRGLLKDVFNGAVTKIEQIHESVVD